MNAALYAKTKGLCVITAEYLIDNIDRAFDNWQKRPWNRSLSFEDFCEYLLPYRVIPGIHVFPLFPEQTVQCALVLAEEKDNHLTKRLHLVDLIHIHIARGAHSLLSGIDISDEIAQFVLFVHSGRNKKRTVGFQIRHGERRRVFLVSQSFTRLLMPGETV